MKNALSLLLFLPCLAMAEDSTYSNPTDGQNYRANWKEYTPANPTLQPSEAVELKGVRLLTGQDVFDKNISVEDLGAFIKETHRNVAHSLQKPAESFAILLDTTLSKDSRPAFQIASQDTVSDATLEKIYNGLKSLPDLRSKADALKYQIHFVITK